MEKIEVFTYHPETFEYLSNEYFDLDSMKDDGSYASNNVTTILPPATRMYEVAVFNVDSQEWTLAVDYRGLKYWLDSGEEAIVQEIGEIIPEGLLLEHSLFPVESPDTVEWKWINNELTITDRCFVPDYGPVEWTDTLRNSVMVKILQYRRELKDGPVSKKFPQISWRPIWPEDIPRPAGS